MKKLIIFLLLIVIVLAGCSAKPKDSNNTNGNALENFRGYIEQSENPSEIKAYLDQLMAGADTEVSDALILEYLNYMDSILSSGTEDPLVYSQDAGFKYISNEGDEYPIIDYRFIEAYSEQISQEISDFAAFMALNSDTPWAKDAGIVIPINDLADRVALGEQFVTNYPGSVMKDKILVQFEYYFFALLAGTDNTPLFSFDTYTADPEFLEAYDYFLKTYPELKAAETVAFFKSELEQVNYKAPYTYSEYDKRAEFMEHIHKLVDSTVGQIDN